MEDQMIVWEMPDGTVQMATCPANNKKPGETKQEWLLRAFNKTVRGNFPGAKRILNPVMPDGQPFRPGAKKLFYGAWRHTGSGNVDIDMPAARDIYMEKMRRERDARLDASDKEKARLDDVGTATQKTAIKTYRQALRNLPANIDLESVTTPEDLDTFETVWPVLG